MIAGLGLAIGSAALINLGFLLQHRGLSGLDADSRLRGAVRSRQWLAGQGLGIVGFAAQVTALALAPLALVQAFAAGGLALSLPLAAGLFGQRVERSQALAVLAIAGALAVLPLGTGANRDVLDALSLGSIVAGLLLAGLLAFRTRVPTLMAIAAGLLYGATDASLKAVAVLWRDDGAGALLSVWPALALVGTAAGFLCFQAALREGGAVSSVTLMTGSAALVALGCGVLALGERFGNGPLVTAGHLLAVGVVLICVRPLAAGQAALVDSLDASRER
ncbi:MAG: hypothetical protein ACR2ND_08860 [Solirubrobacteraceae bacterium]